ncbi:MAG: hypothetical protein KDB14_03885 [Planctomycetales bacterium]|nr:hypothetical protein [Planctomycetales bacterium]
MLRFQVLRASVLLLVLPAVLPALADGQTLRERLLNESAKGLAEAARKQGDAVRGAIEFTRQELACAQCHRVGATNLPGPDLTRLGDDVTDVRLVEALLDPSKLIRKGFEAHNVATTDGEVLVGRILEQTPERITIRLSVGDMRAVTVPAGEVQRMVASTKSAMPDNLVDQLRDRSQFLDLVRYVMELADSAGQPRHNLPSPGGQVIREELQGMSLLNELNCSACHRDDVTQGALPLRRAPLLGRSASGMDPAHVKAFIAAPAHIKPGATMPDVMHGLPPADRAAAAEEVTQFLASLSTREFARQALDATAAARGRETFHTVGCVACHSPRDASGTELLSTTSVPLGPVNRKYNLESLIAFLKDPLETRPSGRMPGMKLTHWEAIDLANYLLSSSAESGNVDEGAPFVRNPKLAAKGRRQFEKLGCVQCHPVGGRPVDRASQGSPAMEARPVSAEQLPLSRVRPDQGCLSESPGAWPDYSLSPEQRSAIRAALKRPPSMLEPGDQVALTLSTFRCLNCHRRDDLGGVTAERDSHFQTTNPNLGPQGRIPPTLSGVGAKLNKDWTRRVLVSGKAIRPYVLTRMPQYGAENVGGLVELFAAADTLEPSTFASDADEKELRQAGADLAGTSGLNCIVCHTFQMKKAANMSAVDLTEMAERLQKNWFYHYMLEPQQLSPNTIMPSFWPGGRAMRRDLLEGDAKLQIEALWQYLLEGRQARAPRGLIVEPIELLATDEAVMLRRSYPGIGKRGIGVGYPLQVNIAYDAEQMRLAMVWKGKFADPGGVWRSQGHGAVRPLGESLVRFSPGPDVDDLQSPWQVDDGRPPRHQFGGYSLDEKMRPRFKYRVGNLEVEDYFMDAVEQTTNPDNPRPFLRRTLSLRAQGKVEPLAFRPATGKLITRIGPGEFDIDRQMRVRIVGDHKIEMVSGNDDEQQLRIPLQVSDAAEVTIEYRWQSEERK